MKALIRKGQIICDGDGHRYLVVGISEDSINCLNEDWNPEYIGLAFANQFFDCDNDRDLQKIADYINPGTTLKQNVGDWSYIGDRMFVCTNCGTYYTLEQLKQLRVRLSDTDFPKYCPACGAKMNEGVECD